MASFNYKTYIDIGANGAQYINSYNNIVNDITAAYAWESVDADSENSTTTFTTSTGGTIVVSYDSSNSNVKVEIKRGGISVYNGTVKKIGYLNTAKSKAFIFLANYTEAATAVSVEFNGIALSNGINTATGTTCNDLMSYFSGTSSNGCIFTNVDDSYNSNTVTNSSISAITGSNITVAAGLYGKASSYISKSAYVCLASPMANKIENAVTVDGKKYFQIGYFLFADE